MAQKDVFTKDELESFTIPALRRLCKYFDIKYSNSTGKKKLVSDIMAYMKKHKISEVDVEVVGEIENAPKRSAMAQRIYDGMNKEK